MIIISLSGPKQSGKTTVANVVKEIFTNYDSDLNVRIISWADALKEEVAKACGVSVEYIEQNKQNFRLILQGWGTDFRRDLCNKCYWIEQLLIKLSKDKNSDVIIIPDTRFLNEVTTLKELGAYLFKIDKDTKLDDSSLHISENELKFYDKWDEVINNNCPLGELRGNVIIALEKIRIIKF